jgi:hypothetical protein
VEDGKRLIKFRDYCTAPRLSPKKGLIPKHGKGSGTADLRTRPVRVFGVNSRYAKSSTWMEIRSVICQVSLVEVLSSAKLSSPTLSLSDARWLKLPNFLIVPFHYLLAVPFPSSSHEVYEPTYEFTFPVGRSGHSERMLVIALIEDYV